MTVLRDTARRFANRDAWIEGRDWFEAHVAGHPEEAEAHAHLAFFVVKESRYDTARAFALLDTAQVLDERCAIAWVYRAMILGTLLRGDEAEAALRQAEALGAREDDVVRTRAWTALDLWHMDEAIDGFERLTRICPESSSCVLLATAYLQAGRHGAALGAARDAVAREADDFRGHAYAGVALLALDRLDEARAALAEAAALQPLSPLVHHTLGVVAMQAGDRAEAERHVREAVRVDPLYVTAQKLLGDICAASGRPGEARACYEAALALFPDYTAARARLEALG